MFGIHYRKTRSNNNSNENVISIDWKRILSRDHFECLQSLICQLTAQADGNNEPEAKLLMEFVRRTHGHAPAAIDIAYSRGLLMNAVANCYEQYPFCMYSVRTMLKLLQLFGE